MDAVRDGRHLMQQDEPDLARLAHARVTGGAMDDTVRLRLPRGLDLIRQIREEYERTFPRAVNK